MAACWINSGSNRKHSMTLYSFGPMTDYIPKVFCFCVCSWKKAVVDLVAIWRPARGETAVYSNLKVVFCHSYCCEGLTVLLTKARSPCGMSEGDVIPFGPACKHLFLCDKAVVVPPSTALVLDVCHTFIRSPGLVVVVGQLLGSCFFPRERRVVACKN